MDITRQQLQRRINEEHGINFHKNINISGYTFYRKDSFISFHFAIVNKITVVKIDYLYVTCKTDFLKLMKHCIKFWTGYNVAFVYYKEHKRQANYAKKFFSAAGMTILEEERENQWKSDWTSTNGYPENSILEAFL